MPAGEAGKGCAAGGEPPGGHLGCSLNHTEQEGNSGSREAVGENTLQTAEKREAHPWDRGPRRPVRGPVWAVDTAKPLLSRMCSFPGGVAGTPCFTLAAPSDSGPNTCFLPVLTSTFLTSF